ncbi:hypothetical protein [Pedobacter nototheniae]|uniref:hypothetical protein n=1 Tax=Pedobacter nototheniae TaxID=2488994 RepID=UPI00292E5465|nr:hypothetical protein [Pedobacter nototheniae]
MPEICTTITLEGREIELIAKTAQKLICYYTVPSLSANPVIFSAADKAITSVAGQLGDAGTFINAQDSLNSITKKIIEVIPALSLLKSSDQIAFMQILEIHPIDQISFMIAVKISEGTSLLGNVTIDGVGFQIKVTKTG